MNGGQSTGVSLLGLAAILLRRWRYIAAATVVGGLIALTLAFFRTTHWTSTFSVMPQASADGSPAGLASLAGQFGVSLGGMGGGGQQPQFYSDLVHTREVLMAVQREPVQYEGRLVSVAEVLKMDADDPELLAARVIKRLRLTVVSASPASRTTGVVSVRVRTRDAGVSHELAERLLARLNAFDVETRRTQAAEERRFVESQHGGAVDSLRAIEDRLQAFMRANRDYASSPRLSFEYDRYMRALSAQQGVVSGFDQALQEARIREVRDTPVLTIIDRPSRPVEPDPRGRLILLLGGVAGGLGVGVVLALLVDALARVRRDQDSEAVMLRDEWQRARGRG